jgi:pimeloyl-ACP methyl ester carboxylesterase
MQRLLLATFLLVLTEYGYAQGETFDSDGVSIHYTDQGSGEPIVLVHGLTQTLNGWHFAGIVDELSNGYRVITVDLRGHGKSGKPHEPEDYGWNVGSDIVRLLDHLDLDMAHLIGYSMGASIVGSILVRNSDRVLTATLASGYFPHWDDSEEEFARFTEERGRRGERFPWEPEDQDFAALAAAIRGAQVVEVLDEEITAVTVPTLVIFGSDELERVPMEARRYVTTPTANLSSLIIEGANHDDSVIKPEFLTAVMAHIARH